MCVSIGFGSTQQANQGQQKRSIQRIGLLLVLFASITPLVAQRSSAQAVAEVRSTGPIPQNNDKTWSLFLVCNQDWLAPEKSVDLYHLYQQFRLFGSTLRGFG